MNLILTFPGVLGLGIQLALFVYFARVLPLGAFSLPCMTILTSLIYFYVMPVTSLLAGIDSFFGMPLTSLEETHWVTLLYVGGATIAFVVNRRALALNPSPRLATDKPPNQVIYVSLWVAVILSLVARYAIGQFNVAQNQEYQVSFENSNVAFLTLGLSMAISLTLIYLIRDNFGPKSLGLLFVILYLCSVAAFRFRILLVLCAAMICFALVRGIKIRIWMVLVGSIGGIALMNLIGLARSYGAGLSYSQVESKSLAEAFSSFGGELGIVYVTQYTATNPFIQFIGLDPWIVAVTRFVPTFLWHDKPTANYLGEFIAGFPARGAAQAGIAAPQQVEMLLQFGWFGVPCLTFLYFSLITRFGCALMRLGREARIAGFAMIPPFFGYYMQSRGYFFQMVAEAIFTFLPLFILDIKALRPTALAFRRRPQVPPNLRSRMRKQ